MSNKLKKELQEYRDLFSKLRPMIILAISEYYTGEDREQLKEKYKKLSKRLP